MTELPFAAQDGNELPLPLEESLTVELIAAFDLRACALEDDLRAVRSNPEYEDFDFVPVRDGRYIVGLLAMDGEESDTTIENAMVRLRESHIISSNASIISFIESADELTYRLVLRNRVIDGVVTWADLNKLSVRPAIFLLVTHLELLMARWIRSQRAPDEAVDLLNPRRREGVERRWAQLLEENLAIDRVAATEIADKKTLLVRLDFPNVAKGRIKKELEEVEWLRNGVAHAGDYAGSRENTQRTIETVKITRRWIDAIQRELA